MLIITPNISIPDHEVKIYAIRAQGSGGQNVNKVSSESIAYSGALSQNALNQDHRQRPHN